MNLTVSFSVVFYIFVLAFVLWGGRLAKSGEYHEDFLSLDSMKALRGIAAFIILFHHISQRQALMDTGELQFFYDKGPFLVAIFFFSSGYGLIKNLKLKKESYFNGFLKKRLLIAIAIPFFVDAILYEIYYLIAGRPVIVPKLILSLLGLNLSNEYAWFPIVLGILYLSFYVIFKNIKNHKVGYLLIFLIIILQGLTFSIRGHFAWWAGRNNWWVFYGAIERAPWWKQELTFWFHGQWWVNSSIGFLVGMLFAEHEEKLVSWFKRKYWIKLFLLLILAEVTHIFSLIVQSNIGYYTEYYKRGPGIGDKFVTYLAQLPEITFFLLALFILMMKFKSSNPISRFFGEYSLHTYLMNLMALNICDFIIYKGYAPITKPWHWNQAVFAVAVVLLTIVLALIEKSIVSLIQKKIR